jgi:hypothetical protein
MDNPLKKSKKPKMPSLLIENDIFTVISYHVNTDGSGEVLKAIQLGNDVLVKTVSAFVINKSLVIQTSTTVLKDKTIMTHKIGDTYRKEIVDGKTRR